MIIYKITNLINNKVYIGKTSKTLKWRFKKHLYDAHTNQNTNIYIQRALLKYGEDNFVIEEIDSAKDIEELNEKEKYWISFYKSNIYGYNMTIGGDGGDTYSSLTEEKLNEVKQKISSKLKGINNGLSKQIKCKSIITNEELVFDALIDCCKYFGVKNKSFIRQRINNKCNYLYRNEWMFAYIDDDYSNYALFDSSTRKGTKVKLIKDGVEIVFNSINKAIKYIGSNKRNFKKDLEKLNYQIMYL